MYPKATDRKAIPMSSPNGQLGLRIRMPLEYAFELCQQWLDRQTKKKAEDDLMAMPDYLLKDMGISRGQIPGVIKRAPKRH